MTDPNQFVDLSELRGRLAYDYDKVPSSALDDAIICGAQKLAQRPLLEIRADLTRDLTEGESVYSWARHLPDDMEMSGITEVIFCGDCIPPIKDKCDTCSCGWRLCTMDSIELQPAIGPGRGQTLEVCLSLRPTSDACKLPKVMVDRWWKIIRDFARAELSAMPNQDWTNIRYSQHMERQAMGAVRCEIARIKDNGVHGKSKSTGGRKWLLGSTKARRVR